MSTFAIIAGGGTAGHVVPGLAIAQELVARGVPTESVRYVGSSRGIETRLVPDAGFPLTVLPGRGIQRKLALANVGAIFGLISAVIQSIVLVGRARPAVVVGLGGYASVPCVLGAVLWRVPIVVAEQNAVPGAANRMAGRFAKACAVSFECTDLPRAVWTGNPVRREVLAIADASAADRADARERLGIDADRSLIAVFGGSLGARRINHSVADAVAAIGHRSSLAVRHVSGRRDHAELLARTADHGALALQYDLVEYEDDMPSVYAAADVVLCRAGASSVAELTVAGVPSILVPLPGAPGDHQTANARALVEGGAARLVSDADFDAERARVEIEDLVDDLDRRAAMASAARGLARPDAAAAVVDLVAIHAHRSVPKKASS
ncbi:MAG: undecaprenyldiphospho-muramoylpentapeptide beta-N-acetylglucosaminyltransferase [Acidimicrobiales bacterium]|nr:undecaprenyldiphospho-muramoylpentapeptide beta-N-acetylglucosaminyltransferase [Acidimicrobiales bacterium]